jgi:hypothetical protein
VKPYRWIVPTAIVVAATACVGLTWWDRPIAAPPTSAAPPPYTGPNIGDAAPAGLVKPGERTAVIVAEKCTVDCPFYVMPDNRLTGFDRIVMITNNWDDRQNYPGAEIRPVTTELLGILGGYVRPKLLVYSKDGRLTFVERDRKAWNEIVDDYLASRKSPNPVKRG